MRLSPWKRWCSRLQQVNEQRARSSFVEEVLHSCGPLEDCPAAMLLFAILSQHTTIGVIGPLSGMIAWHTHASFSSKWQYAFEVSS